MTGLLLINLKRRKTGIYTDGARAFLSGKSVLVRNQTRRRVAAKTRVIALAQRYALLPLPAISRRLTNLFDQTTSASIDELMVEILVVRVVGYIHAFGIEGK